MASMRARIPQIVLVLLGALIALWYYNLEWEEKQIDLGPSAEARRNPVLALQRLLEGRGQSVQLVRGFAGIERLQFGDTPISADDALVLLNTGRSLRPSQVERLWEWMASGGRVLVAVDNSHFDMTALDNDPLLDQLGLTLEGRFWSDLDEKVAEAEESADDGENETLDASDSTEPPATAQTEESDTTEKESAAQCRWRDISVPVSLDDSEHTDLRMEFVSGISFAAADTDARILSAHGDKLFLVHQTVGAGDIYAMPAMQALNNNNIHCEDNAYVVWRLLGDRDKVWLVLNTDSPSFWHHLWQLSAVGCLVLLCALALWVWHKVPRFGPILQERITGRRQFLDHVQAAAQFLFRQQGSDALIVPLREEILQKLRLRQPGFSQLTLEDQIDKVAQLSGMSRADVQLALYRTLPVADPVFIDMIQRLQHLRNAL